MHGMPIASRFRIPHLAQRSVLFLLLLLGTSSAFADTIRVTVDRALVWTRPSGVSIVITQLTKDTTIEAVRRVGDWYEVVLPAGVFGPETRTGYISASQVVLEAVGPPSARTTRPAPSRETIARQPQPPRQHTGFFNIDGGYRLGADDLTRTFKAFSDVLAEEGTIASNYGDNAGWSLEVMIGHAVWRSLGVGVGGSYYLRKRSVAVDARVPHPFFFNQLRTATFDTEPLKAHEAAVHIPVVWMPAFGDFRVLVFAGPSFFRLSQTVVTKVTLNEQYPYDTVGISGVTTEERKGSILGYHAGGDISYFFGPSVGVGGGVRYTRATIEFDSDENVTTVGIAGALEAVAGLRFRF